MRKVCWFCSIVVLVLHLLLCMFMSCILYGISKSTTKHQENWLRKSELTLFAYGYGSAHILILQLIKYVPPLPIMLMIIECRVQYILSMCMCGVVLVVMVFVLESKPNSTTHHSDTCVLSQKMTN